MITATSFVYIVDMSQKEYKMFSVEKDRLVEGLVVIQKSICCYSSQPCDCKYGIKEGNGIGLQARREQTGCPEVMLASNIIRNMTEEEYSHQPMAKVMGLLPQKVMRTVSHGAVRDNTNAV